MVNSTLRLLDASVNQFSSDGINYLADRLNSTLLQVLGLSYLSAVSPSAWGNLFQNFIGSKVISAAITNNKMNLFHINSINESLNRTSLEFSTFPTMTFPIRIVFWNLLAAYLLH